MTSEVENTTWALVLDQLTPVIANTRLNPNYPTQAMIHNTEAQGELHPSLISRDARQIIEIARAHGAIG